MIRNFFLNFFFSFICLFIFCFSSQAIDQFENELQCLRALDFSATLTLTESDVDQQNPLPRGSVLTSESGRQAYVLPISHAGRKGVLLVKSDGLYFAPCPDFVTGRELHFTVPGTKDELFFYYTHNDLRDERVTSWKRTKSAEDEKNKIEMTDLVNPQTQAELQVELLRSIQRVVIVQKEKEKLYKASKDFRADPAGGTRFLEKTHSRLKTGLYGSCNKIHSPEIHTAVLAAQRDFEAQFGQTNQINATSKGSVVRSRQAN